jgi:hypothetical protein
LDEEAHCGRVGRRSLAAVVTALGVAATSGAGPATSAPTAKKKPALPALPSNIKARKRFLMGVKCDAPPFGYINVRGQNAVFDVEIARWSRATHSGLRTASASSAPRRLHVSRR